MSSFDDAEVAERAARSGEPPATAATGCLKVQPSLVAGTWDADPIVEALSESVPCGVLVFGSEGELRLANSHFAEIVECDRNELMALGRFEKVVERLAAKFAEPGETAARWNDRRDRGEPCWDELQLMSPKRKHVERFARAILDRSGRRSAWLEVYRDVTGQKLIERNLFQVERMVTLGQMVSSVAHDLSNPLTSILGFAQLLRRRRETREGEKDVERISDEAERASRIARNLLQFGRGAQPAREAVDINGIVESATALRVGEFTPKDVVVLLELETDLPPVLGDASQLRQVLINLVVNSEQAIRQGRGQGTVRLRTRRVSEDRLAIDVIDDGPGIPPEVLPRIFDPFFSTKPAGVGTGLGLSIAYSIAHDHDGTVAVESRVDCGSTFTVELPVARAPRVAIKGSAAQRREQVTPASGAKIRAPRSGERILVIEDEPTVARLIADVLVEDGYLMDVVLDSRDGLSLIAKRDYALVICDLRMPYLTGRALFEELVQADETIRERFILVTGDSRSPEVARFLKSSGVAYLAKPFFIDELKELVHRKLDGAQGTSLMAVQRSTGASASAAQKSRRRK